MSNIVLMIHEFSANLLKLNDHQSAQFVSFCRQGFVFSEMYFFLISFWYFSKFLLTIWHHFVRSSLVKTGGQSRGASRSSEVMSCLLLMPMVRCRQMLEEKRMAICLKSCCRRLGIFWKVDVEPKFSVGWWWRQYGAAAGYWGADSGWARGWVDHPRVWKQIFRAELELKLFMNNNCPSLWSWLLRMYFSLLSNYNMWNAVKCTIFQPTIFNSEVQCAGNRAIFQLSRLQQVFEERRRFNSLGNRKWDLLLLVGELWMFVTCWGPWIESCSKLT